MSNVEVPLPSGITPDRSYTLAEAEACTTQFLAEEGPWKKLEEAKANLVEIVRTHLPKSKMHRELGDANKLDQVLLGHFGLDGEFRNSPESVIQFNFYNAFYNDEKKSKSFEKKLNDLIDAFVHDESQLAKSEPDGELKHRENVQWLAEMQGKSIEELEQDMPPYRNAAKLILTADESAKFTETKIQAFERCASEIELWAEKNDDHFNENTKAQIAAAIKTYRDALPPVKEYAMFLEQYSHHLSDRRIQSMGEGRAGGSGS